MSKPLARNTWLTLIIVGQSPFKNARPVETKLAHGLKIDSYANRLSIFPYIGWIHPSSLLQPSRGINLNRGSLYKILPAREEGSRNNTKLITGL